MIFNVLKANVEVSNLKKQVEELTAQITSLTQQVNDAKEKEAAVSIATQDWAKEKEAMANAHAEAMVALKNEYEQKLSDKENAVKEATNKAEIKAAEIVASAGLEPETVKLTSDELVSKSVAKSRYTITTFKNK